MDGGVGAIFSAINAAFTFADIISKLQDVPEEALRFSTLINRVRLDYNEALRLWPHPCVQSRFALDPQEQSYVHGTISSVKNALADIGRFVEKIRIQQDGGTGNVSMLKRSEWLWRYRSKVDSSERVLDTSHKSMLAAVHRMVTWISMSPMGFAAPVSPTGGLMVMGAPGPPPYQEAIAEERGDLDEGLVVARRRMTKYDRKRGEKTPASRRENNVSVTVTPTIPTPTEPTINRYDAFPEMSATVRGPIEMVYSARPATVAYATPAPSTYTPSGLEPLPPFRDARVTPQASMMSLRAEYNQFSSTPAASVRSPTSSTWQTSQASQYVGSYANSARGDMQQTSRSTIVSQGGAGARYRDRPRSINASRRDQQAAMMRLSSGRHDC